MRTPKECEEISKVFNLDMSTVETYVQFGEVFNLLHAAASYLRVHQKGFGAVGVSNKYGERSYARYPIFWGLKRIGKVCDGVQSMVILFTNFSSYQTPIPLTQSRGMPKKRPSKLSRLTLPLKLLEGISDGKLRNGHTLMSILMPSCLYSWADGLTKRVST